MHCGFSSHLGSSTSLHRSSLWSLRAVQVMAQGGQRHATAPHRLLPTGGWGKSFPPPAPWGCRAVQEHKMLGAKARQPLGQQLAQPFLALPPPLAGRARHQRLQSELSAKLICDRPGAWIIIAKLCN